VFGWGWGCAETGAWMGMCWSMAGSMDGGWMLDVGWVDGGWRDGLHGSEW